MKIYTAHPISGKSFDSVVGYYEDLKHRLEARGYEVLCPMTAKGYLRTEIKFKAHGYDGFPVSTNHAIVKRDRWMISQCDVVLADLLDTKIVSIGCMFELAWAQESGKHTIVVMEKDNIHRHAFVIEAADILFENIGVAMSYLEYLQSGKLREAP